MNQNHFHDYLSPLHLPLTPSFFQFQPTRKRAKSAKAGGIDPGFDFTHYNQDTWTERLLKSTNLKKVTKRTTLDEKINKRKAPSSKVNGHDDEAIEIKSESDEESLNGDDGFESDDSLSKPGPKKKKTHNPVDDDIDLSDDELQVDELRVKNKKKQKQKGKKKRVDDEDEEEDESNVAKLESDPDYVFETDLSFHQMNLSRPLLKVLLPLCFCSP